MKNMERKKYKDQMDWLYPLADCLNLLADWPNPLVD